MKKTIIRIVAVAMLALMVLTALPAFAYNIVGTAAAQTPVYKDTKGKKVELYVSGPVTINRQDNKSGMYNVTVSYDGKTYTGWVYPSAISGIGYDKSTGGSASGSTSGTTGGTTSGVTGTYTATIATGAAINVNGTNYPVSVGGSINVNYRDAAGTQVNVTVGNVTGWVAASSLSGFRRNGSSISLSDLPTNGGNTMGGTTSPAPTPYVNQNQNQNTASGTFSANLAAGTAITNNGKTVGIVQNAGNVTVNYRDASAPSQRGRLPETAMPASASTRPKITPMIRPCRTRLRASRSSPAPMRCAVWTQKPTVRARHRPLSSHVLEATSPMAALASRPRWPTMDESIYCMAMEDTCARMAGILNCRASSVCCRSVSSSPPRRDSRRSFFTAHTSFRYNRIPYYTRCGGKGQERKSSARRQAGAAACFQWFFSDGPSSAGFSWRRQTCR